MDKVIELNTKKEQFYHHYLQILNGIAKLSDKELSVLARLLLYRDEIGENIEESDAFSGEKATVNRLKKKGLIVEVDGHFEINKSIYVPRQKNSNVTFRLKLIQ